ncbi:CG0192-related protein [Micromonospora sp. NPDC003197]
MALLHRAELRPSKLELLAAWLPGQDWYQGSAIAELDRVAAYRFDDPAGEVGIETMLVQAGDGPIYQVPMTYRGAPLEGGDAWLIGTMEHSALGPRWVYDASGDPVYVAALVDAILAGTGQAEEFFEVDGRREHREPSMTIAVDGTLQADRLAVGPLRWAVAGDPTRIGTESVELAVYRRLDTDTDTGVGAADAVTLTGTWPGQSAPLPLVYASPRRSG